jgi:hypothetical protein
MGNLAIPDKINYPGFRYKEILNDLINQDMINTPVRQLFLIRHGAVGPQGEGRF